jgi:hypothetical protein
MPAGRPNIGGAGGRPNFGGGVHPNFGGGARPNIQRPTANPSLRPNSPTARPNFPNRPGGGMLNPGGVRPNFPGGQIKPTTPINRPGFGGGGIQRPNLPGGGGNAIFPNRPGAGGGGIQRPTPLPGGGGNAIFPNRPGAGGGGIQRPDLPGGGGDRFPNRPGGGGDRFPNIPGGGGDRFPNRPGGGGDRFPNRPDWANRPGGGGSGTQWPDRSNRPDWWNRPGGGGSGTQWPNRPDWNNRPNWPDNNHWINFPNHRQWNNWANRRPDRWNNWGNNNIVNSGNTIRNTVVNNANYSNYSNLFTPNWYGNNWQGSYFTGYQAPSPYFWWNAATTANLTNWLGWQAAAAQPMYYNYGSNVAYTDGTVYVDQQPVASADSYITQAMSLAQAGIDALSTVAQTNATAASAAASQPSAAPPAYTGPEWMPLGVFAVSPDEKTEPTIFLQLALTKDGVIGGTYENTANNSSKNVAGKVDKSTQRAAWAVTDDNQEMVMEAGIFNLTQPQAPVLIHWGKDKTQTWLMVRMDPPKK